MASEKPGPGLEPQPVGLLAVGAGGGGGGGSGGGGSGSGSGSGGGGMGELRGASGSGSVVLPAGMINPSVPIRNIRMKFAVLIGLIQVGEVSNRDIVETVLNLVREKACSPSASQPPWPPSADARSHPSIPRVTRAARPCEHRTSGRSCPAGDLPARCRSHATSLLSSGPLLPPERGAQLNTAYYTSYDCE